MQRYQSLVRYSTGLTWDRRSGCLAEAGPSSPPPGVPTTPGPGFSNTPPLLGNNIPRKHPLCP